jgi:hypothetical protein
LELLEQTAFLNAWPGSVREVIGTTLVGVLASQAIRCQYVGSGAGHSVSEGIQCQVSWDFSLVATELAAIE